MLTVVIPDPINLGYESIRFQVVDKVNDKQIHTLKDLAAAMKTPKDGFYVVEFIKGSAANASCSTRRRPTTPPNACSTATASPRITISRASPRAAASWRIPCADAALAAQREINRSREGGKSTS